MRNVCVEDYCKFFVEIMQALDYNRDEIVCLIYALYRNGK